METTHVPRCDANAEPQVLPEGRTDHCYLPIPNEVFHQDFYVTGLGHADIPSEVPYPPSDQHPSMYHIDWRTGRVLPEFSLMLITKGKGTFQSHLTGQVSLIPGSAIFIFPGVWHRYRPDSSTGWTESWMHFNGKLARILLQRMISPDHPVLHSTAVGEMDQAICDLLAHAQATPGSNSMVISLRGLSVLTTILTKIGLSPDRPKKAARKQEAVISHALEYIWSKSDRVLSVSDVAQALGVNRRTLERHMNASYGGGVLDAIMDCRFRRAERFLQQTDLPIEHIFSLVGFGSSQTMRQTFKQRTGMTPRQIRKRFRSEPDSLAD